MKRVNYLSPTLIRFRTLHRVHFSTGLERDSNRTQRRQPCLNRQPAVDAMEMPSFSSGALLNSNTAMIAVRESEDQRTRVADDDLWLIDINDEGRLELSDRNKQWSIHQGR